MVGPKVIIVSVHILYVRFMGFKDFQDWTGPDTGLTISERIKILKLFELDNFGLKDQFGLVFVYFEQILMSFMITLIKECIANNYRCNIKPKITKNNYRIQFQDVVPIQMLAGCTSGISSALIG